MFASPAAPVTQESVDTTTSAPSGTTCGKAQHPRRECFTPIPPPRRIATSVVAAANDGTAKSSSSLSSSSDAPTARAGSNSNANSSANLETTAVIGGRTGRRGGQRGSRASSRAESSNSRQEKEEALDRPSHDAVVVVSLCPSMDLMVLGSPGHHWALHRTMNPQRLSSKAAESIGGSSSADNNSDSSRPNVGISGCWREDGRLYAIVAPSSNEWGSSSPRHLSVQLYAVEDMMKDWNSSPALASLPFPSMSQWDEDGEVKARRGSPVAATTTRVAAAAWSGVGAPHPSWERSELEREREWNNENVTFPAHYPPSKYHTSYVIESKALVAPGVTTNAMSARGNSNSWDVLNSNVSDPSHHHHHPHHDDDGGASRTVLPSAHPYSLLAVLTRTATSSVSQSNYRLTTFLHGRYPYVVDLPLLLPRSSQHRSSRSIKTRDEPDRAASSCLAMSHTLSHVVAAIPTATLSLGPSSATGTAVAVARLPRTAPRDAAVAARVIALNHHLERLAAAIPDIASGYASSIQPLNVKLEALAATIGRYSVRYDACDDEGGAAPSAFLARCLAAHIMGTSLATDMQLPAALEQYFSSVQFNDQLFGRMEQSVSVALAGIESSVQERLVAPCQAAVVQSGELLGLELSSLDHDDDEEDADEAAHRERTSAARTVVEAAKHLYLSVERILREVVETRFVLRDWMEWLRSAAAATKARGTPATSALHQQAVQRRATDDLTKRILRRLVDGAPNSPSKDGGTEAGQKRTSRAEAVLGLQLGCLLEDLPAAAQRVASSLQEWQKGPCEAARARTRVRTLTLAGQRVLALTTRIGFGSGDQDRGLPISSSLSPNSSAEKGCFVPHPRAGACKEWIVTACQDAGGMGGTNCVNLYAFPLEHQGIDDYDDDDEYDEGGAQDQLRNVGWVARLQLESSDESAPCSIVDAVFYGDNGKCTLSSMDGGTGTERRQSLVLLVEDAASKVLELWLVKYDSCHFSPVSLASADPSHGSAIVVEGNYSALPAPHSVTPILKGRRCEDEEGEVLGTKIPAIGARTRTIGSAADGLSSVRLEVSGSRGVGAVVSNHPTLGTAVIDLYDLEEDEEDEEGSDDEGDDDDMQTD